MPRTRSIKPEFWDDEKLSGISRDARLTFIGLWTNSDDYGVVKGHPAYLKNKIFPYDDIKPKEFEAWLRDLETLQCIIPFSSNGEKYYHITHFLVHQSINHPSKRIYPEPPPIINDGLPVQSRNTPVILPFETETETETETLMRSNGALFETFWTAYPKKKSKGQAEKAWLKIKPDEQLLERILSTIERAKTSVEWMKDGGQFIPHPATWLNAKGWEDEIRTENKKPW